MNIKKHRYCGQCDEAIKMLKPGSEPLRCLHRHATFSRKQDGGLAIRFDTGYEPKERWSNAPSLTLN